MGSSASTNKLIRAKGLSTLLLLWMLSGYTVCTFAQISSGTLTGNILDSGGASVPNCPVTASDLGSGGHVETRSDGAGLYYLPSLRPGAYHVVVQCEGFGTAIADITIDLNKSQRQDFHLTVASSQQSVEVQAGMELLQPDSHELATTLPSTVIVNLPSSSRGVFSTLQSLPNVQTYALSNGNSDIDFYGTGNNSLTVGGTTYGNTSYLQDGVTNYNLLTKTANLQPSPEIVDQVSVQENGASARYEGPAVINVVTKRGQNQIHGMVYDYLQNNALNARARLDPAILPPLRYNQFGANIGVPILRNKVFAFFAYDGLRSSSSTTGYALVPTAAERAGDFSADPFTIYDPATYNPTTGTISAFPANKITTISSFASQYLAYYPLPSGNFPGGTNFSKTISTSSTYDSFLGRIDYNISTKDSLYGAIVVTNPITRTGTTSASSIFDPEFPQNATNGYVQETHTFGSTLVNVARFGYNYSNILETLAGAGTANFSDQFKVPFVTPTPNQQLPPIVSLSLHGGFGNAFAPQGATQRLFEYSDEVNKLVGKHTLFLGVEVDQIRFNGSWSIWNSGQFNFNGQYTSNHSTSALAGGSDIADFLLGLPSVAFGAKGTTTGFFPFAFVMPYFQDDWKIKPNLTLNLGLRYDFYQAPNDTGGRSNIFDPSTNTNRSGTYNQQLQNLAPRLGLAYSADTKTVFRGGYGIYYSPFYYNQLAFLLANPPNYILQINSFGINQPTPYTDTFNPNGGSALAPFTIAAKLPTQRIQQWNVTMERQLGKSWVATLSYLGDKADHLQQRINANQANPDADPTNPTPVNSRRPNPHVGDVYQVSSLSYGNFNALQSQLSKRFADGFSLESSYVWSKSLDTGSDDNENSRFRDQVGLDYGPSNYNRTNVFKLSGVYELPIGPGKKMLNANTFVNRELLGGWQISGIFVAQSGTPLSVRAADLSNTGGDHDQYADLVCNPNQLAHRSYSQWFNTSCFVQPGIGRLGTSGRNIIVGPGYQNIDASVFKNFAIADRGALQFRADFFSFPNHSQGVLPEFSQTVGNSGYGQVLSFTGQRRIQLSLKATF